MILLTKLDSLHRCIRRLADKTPDTPEALTRNYDLQDIITLNLERAVQSCVDIAAHILANLEVPPPSTMAESFEKLYEMNIICEETKGRMIKAVGFRNVAVHEYQRINWQIVFRILSEHLVDFESYARQVKKWSDENEV